MNIKDGRLERSPPPSGALFRRAHNPKCHLCRHNTPYSTFYAKMQQLMQEACWAAGFAKDDRLVAFTAKLVMAGTLKRHLLAYTNPDTDCGGREKTPESGRGRNKPLAQRVDQVRVERDKQ